MLRKLLILGVLPAFLTLLGAKPVFAVPFGLYPESEFSPDFELVLQDDSHITFQLHMTRLQSEGAIDLNQRQPGTWGEMNATGRLIPRISFYLSIPATGNPTLVVDEWTTVTRNAAARNIPENPSNLPNIELGPIGIFSGVRLLPVTVRPIDYTNNQTTCEVLDEATITVNFDQNPGVNPLSSTRVAFSEPSRKVMQAVVMNWEQIPNIFITEPSHMLIVAPTAFINGLEDYFTWKRQAGIQLTIIPEDEVHDGDGTALRNRIISELSTASPRIDYVELIGDETQIPVHYQHTDDPVTRFSDATFPGQYTNEGFYTELEGSDKYPDVFLGRWPVNTQNEMLNVASRTINHESNTFAQDSLRFEKCVASADNSVDSQEQTIARARLMMLDAGFESVDTVYASHNGNAEQMIQLVNSGCTFVNHRGSGWNQGWAGIQFYVNRVNDIANAGRLPIVTGIGCGVGKFDAPDNQCFGELWMTVGTTTAPRGAAGFVGPCWNTHTVYNDVLDTCLYRAILDFNINHLAPALVTAKMLAYCVFMDFVDEGPVQEVAGVMMRQYLVLSDPSLMLFTDTPERLPVSLPQAIPSGPYSLPVTIAGGFNTETDSIVVSFWSGLGESFTQLVPAQQGEWLVPVNFDFGADVIATVYGHNFLTRQWVITVAPQGPYLVHDGISFSDAQGNGDGRIQPGETIQVTDTTLNIGNATAMSAAGALSSPEENVNITQDVAFYGDIPPGAISTNSPAFELIVSPEFRGNNFALEITYGADGMSSRSDESFLTLFAPEIEREGLTIDDGENGRLDRNEVAGLVFLLRNTGNDTLQPGTLSLSTESPYLLIPDGTADIPLLAPGSTYIVPATALQVGASWNTPTETSVELLATLGSEMDTYTFERTLSIPLQLAQVAPSEPMAGSDGMYYLYDDTDTDYEQAPVYDWLEISPAEGGLGTLLPFNTSHQTISVDVPFTYSYFGQEFTTLSVSTDGWVQPGTTQSVSYVNTPLPWQQDFVNGMIGVLWQDLWYYFGDEDCEVSYYYDTASDRFLVEWYRIGDWASGTHDCTFQLQLLNPATYPTPSGDAEWLFMYHTLDMHPSAAGGATIGYENISETLGATYYHNSVYPPTSATLQNGRAIRLTTSPPVLLDAPRTPAELPSTFALRQNYPNPFNPETSIEFNLPAFQQVKLEVFDVLGRSVKTLVDAPLQAGVHIVQWHGKDNSGVNVPSGLYFYRLSSTQFVETRRMLLLR